MTKKRTVRIKKIELKALDLLVADLIKERDFLRERNTDLLMDYHRECERRDRIIADLNQEIGRLMNGRT